MAMENDEKGLKKVKTRIEGAADAAKKPASAAAQTVRKVVKKAEGTASDGRTAPETKQTIARKPEATANAAARTAPKAAEPQTADDAPKKKKMTVVFRTQNSAQNSLKVRPAGAVPKKRPAQPAQAPVKRVP